MTASWLTIFTKTALRRSEVVRLALAVDGEGFFGEGARTLKQDKHDERFENQNHVD